MFINYCNSLNVFTPADSISLDFEWLRTLFRPPRRFLVISPLLAVPWFKWSQPIFRFLLPKSIFQVYHYYHWYLYSRVFYISISWWVSIEVWVTVSLLWSGGLHSVFWPIPTILQFKWCRFFLPISNCFNPLSKHLRPVPNAQNTFGIRGNVMFNSFY